MSINKLVTIGENIKNLRESIGLSQHDFSIITEVSKRSIANIESGNHDYKIKLLYKIVSFLNLKLENISNENFYVPENFREQIISHYKKDDHYKVELLEKRPNIVYVIKYKLIPSGFLNKPREINEIRALFKSWEWFYPSSSITNALTRMTKEIEVRKHKSKGNTNVYLKK